MATTVTGGGAGAAPGVDHNVLRTNQAVIVGLVVIAFVSGSDVGAWLIAALAVAMAIGAARPGSGPILIFYRTVLVPSGLVKAKPRPDDPAKHRFAQVVGATCLAASALLLFAGVSGVGWALAWLVVALALVNLLFGFCAGCFLFLQLRRAGVLR